MSRQRGNDLDRFGLLWIDAFRWLRPAELGAFLWPRQPTSTKSAERLIRKWENRKRHWVLRRSLGDSGSAILLSEAGVAALTELVHGTVKVRSGKDWGDHERDLAGNSVWVPPSTWRHELLQSSLLAWFVRNTSWRVVPERFLRRLGAKDQRIPDALIVDERDGKIEHGWWCEVENARKSGEHMRAMAQKLIDIARAGRVHVCEKFTATAPMLAVVQGQRDERGYNLAHAPRVVTAIQKLADDDLELMLAIMQVGASGAVEDVIWGNIMVRADSTERALAAIEWVEDEGIKYGNLPSGVQLTIERESKTAGGRWFWTASLRGDTGRERGEPKQFAQGVASTAKQARRDAYRARKPKINLGDIAPA